MLQPTAATVAEMTADRRLLMGRSADHSLQSGFGKIFFLFADDRLDDLPGQRLLDKNHQISITADAGSAKRQAGDRQGNSIAFF